MRLTFVIIFIVPILFKDIISRYLLIEIVDSNQPQKPKWARSLSNEFDLENSDIWPTATTPYSDYLSNRGYRLNNFAKRRKSRQIEPTSSDERIDDLKECKKTKLGIEYRGNLTRTKTGITCQVWSTQFPHNPSPWAKDVQNYPDDSILEAGNNCRNPDREPEGPWCYTTNPEIRWEYCNIPMCRDKSNEAPQYSITLPGGFVVSTKLSMFNTPIKDLENSSNQESCNYIGNLIGDSSSVMSATGCLQSSNMKYTNDINAISVPRKKIKSQLTIFSSSTNISKFMVLENGYMLEVKPDGLKDLSISDLKIAKTAKIRVHKPLKVVPNDLVSNEKFPKELNLTLVYGYERSVKDYFINEYPSDWDTQIKNWIKDIHTHTQSFYWLTSLKTKINLQVVKEPTYIDEYLSMTMNDSNVYKSLIRLRTELPKLSHSNVHMYIWFTNLPTMDDEAELPDDEKSPAGITGTAKKPVICTSKKVALIRGPSRLDQNTAETVAHELGHALGMFHDWLKEYPSERYFHDSSKGEKVKCTGFMDTPLLNLTTNITIVPPNRWSGCSVHDFRSAFEQEKWNETCFRDLINTGCTSDQFTCANGQFIPSADRCNDVSDCTDGSDEQGCGQCATASGKRCLTVPWVYMNGDVRTLAHYQNCVPFRITTKGSQVPFDGPNPPIYDLNSGGNRDKIQGQDYDFFCPVITSEFNGHRGINLNKGSSFRRKYSAKDVFERCINLDANPHCKSTKSLEQLRSPKLTLDCKTKPVDPLMDLGLDSRAKNLPVTDTCTPHIWKAIDNGGPLKWARGCKPFGSKRNPKYKCAVYADSQGVGFLLADCLPDNPEGCKMKRPRLRQDKTTDFIWPVET